MFPEIAYYRIVGNERLPFADRSFDIATANAVLEHVGSVDNQREFIAELLRVSRMIFVTVPNRLFPVEHHTAIPLLHFFESTFQFACKLTGNSEWARTENLILMSKERLLATLPKGGSLHRKT